MVLLCIDNEPAILDGMRMLLSGWGCQVITAASLTEAFDSLKPAADAPFKSPTSSLPITISTVAPALKRWSLCAGSSGRIFRLCC